MFERTRFFWKRRIRINLEASALVLDVGCGDMPHWRADIFVDAYVDESGSSQRPLGGGVPLIGPLFEADLENLPFRDKIFDYVICSHVLEHVIDPIACIKEIIRIGKQGYIELPFAGFQKITDFPAHLWLCDKKPDGSLVFIAKKTKQFDPQITQFVEYGKIKNLFAHAVSREPDSAIIQVWWENSIAAKTDGLPNSELLNNIEKPINSWQRKISRLIYQLLVIVCRLVYWKKFHTKLIYYNDIVKDEFALKKNCRLQKRFYKA